MEVRSVRIPPAKRYASDSELSGVLFESGLSLELGLLLVDFDL